MNFSEFVRLVESDWETPERREAREAAEAYARGEISLYRYIKAQPPGFRKVIDGVEYLSSFDSGPMVKKMYPVAGSRGTAIGQKSLYSPPTLKRYTEFLKNNPAEDTEALAVIGEPDNYKIYDGHHRHQAYKDAGRTHVPVWIPMTPD